MEKLFTALTSVAVIVVVLAPAYYTYTMLI